MPTTKQLPKKDTMSEHAHQCAVMTWSRLALKQRPELDYLVAIPNGGARHIAVARKLKAEGVKKGFPDLQLNLPRGGFAGLFIELKSLTGRTSPEQKEWLKRLNAGGNRAVVCKGWLAAQTEIINYLDGRIND
jgi:hypothetical protein